MKKIRMFLVIGTERVETHKFCLSKSQMKQDKKIIFL